MAPRAPTLSAHARPGLRPLPFSALHCGGGTRDPEAMEGAGPGPAWRRHVRRELERRERETRRVQGLVQSHEKLLERRDLERLLVEKLQLEPGTQESRAPLELASLQLQQAVELAELRGAQEELAQSVAHLSDAPETQRDRMPGAAGQGRALCPGAGGGLAGCCRELQAQLWEQGQEAEGLRAALGAALRARDQLEARWVQEKELEAQRVNETNAREERPGTELVTSENTSCEELIQRPDPLLSWTEMPPKWLHQGTLVLGSIGGGGGVWLQIWPVHHPPFPQGSLTRPLYANRCLVLMSIFEYALCSFA
ncbi:autophagy-related protein 16-like isoform X2 [Chrysemys picta bellii]|uniref:autophagy-related protein 16-like isoform X2 n=1 Tax=Chrysemys picta bellii TaxID=8478 RepID=UPI0032B2EE9D